MKFRLLLTLGSSLSLLCLASCGSGSNTSNPTNKTATIDLQTSSKIQHINGQPTYTVSGNVNGLTEINANITLLNNNSDPLNVQCGFKSTPFMFGTPILAGESYNVTIESPVNGAICSVENGSGTNIHNNITNVNINCRELYSQLYSFKGENKNDGKHPGSGLILGDDGNLYGVTSTGGSGGIGTIYKISESGAETVLYSFNDYGNNGASPHGNLVEFNGEFYGTTMYSSAVTSGGIIFKVNKSGSKQTIHFFAGINEGNTPTAGMVLATDGKMYGTTQFGGIYDLGTVFSIDPKTESFTTVYTFKSTNNDGKNPVAALIEGKDGNLYGTTQYGGANGYGTIFKVTKSGSEKVLYSFTGNGIGANPQSQLLQDSNGDFYGEANKFSQESAGNSLIYRYDRLGIYSVIYSFKDINDGMSASGGLIQGIDGDLYGTTEYGVSDEDGGTIFKVTLSGQKQIIYQFNGRSGEYGGLIPVGSLLQTNDGALYGVTHSGGVDNNGMVYRLMTK